jgi:methylated-DNA-[protein]-cysteine S-methyltransferase
MKRNNNDPEKRIAVWLGDEKGRLERDDLLDCLDAKYSAGPERIAMDQADTRLKETMREAKKKAIFYDILTTSPVGQVLVALNHQGIVAVEIGMSEEAFIDGLERSFSVPVLRSQGAAAAAIKQLQEYFERKRRVFDLPLSLSHLTQFQRSVLEATMDISSGTVTTYGELARRLGKSRAARAVGQALARNPIPILIPCHRVLGSDGALHGYSGGEGIKTKEYLLKFEGALSS